MRSFLLFFFCCSFLQAAPQNTERVVFDAADSSDGYYLAVPPRSKNIQGVLVLCISFAPPEAMLPETRLHHVAFANDLLTVMVSLKQKLYADTATVDRLQKILQHVTQQYQAPSSKFVLAGYDFAGNIALRFTEMAQQHPGQFPVQPKAVMAVGSPVDLFALWRWCDRQISKNSRSAWDAGFIADLMQREQGSVTTHPAVYRHLTPFHAAVDSVGNEQYLKNIPVRLYYDADLEWLLRDRQSSLFDTFIPEGSELVSRLLRSGNSEAEFITAKQPGKNSRGLRSTNALSIVDEVDCIHWIKNKLDIFDPHTWQPPYSLPVPRNWTEERFAMPIDFAPQIPFKGIEDVRFAPGWGDVKTEEYWSYSFLWWIEGRQQINADSIQKHLKAYYEGLVGRNIKERKIPASKIVATQVMVKPVKTNPNDAATYQGTIRMLDYMTAEPITFQLTVSVKKCAELNRTAVVTQVSPMAFTHEVWKVLNKISDQFSCNR